jgi:hypothetical protein
MKQKRIIPEKKVNSSIELSKCDLTLFVILMIITIFLAPNNIFAQTGLYTLNGGTDTQTNQTYAATGTDQSAVYVLNSGHLTLNTCTLTKTGDASSVNNSSQYGTNAGVLVTTAGNVTINGGTITTNASGGNGLFATGTGSSITMSNGTISASGGSAHGVDVTYGGIITLTNVDVTTNGSNSSALATDFGGGTVSVTGGTIIASATASGSHSAGIYSTGSITVTNANVTSSGDCGGVIDGANSIALVNTSLTGLVEGIKVWKTAPMTGSASISINGGSLNVTGGDAFYITGETGNAASAVITLSNGASISASTGKIINVLSSSTASLTADGETLSGILYADATSTLNVTLKNSTTLQGKAQKTGITMDASSSWTLTGNSILTTFIDPSGVSGTTITNVTGNGYSIHYDSSLTANQYLGGKVYSLVNGGVLTPATITGVQSEGSITPVEWQLYQNYPNPFNPSTNIKFSVAKAGAVKLKVFDVTGREVKTLIDEVKNPGSYEVNFNAGNLTSGVYFYRLVSEGTVLTKKMVLIK